MCLLDKDKHTRKSELSVGACYLARCRCRGIGAKKISLVNEVQCGTGTEWRDLIGQHKHHTPDISIHQKETHCNVVGLET